MSVPAVTVELGLNAVPLTGQFVLDSDTLGLLGTSKLSGFEWLDVSDRVRQVQIRRGRSRQLDYFNAGSAVVSFYNEDRLFDPLNTASVFYPAVEPRCLVRVSCRGFRLFTGFVNDWDLDYDISGMDMASASCSDAFMILSNQLLSDFTPSEQLTGARINTVLNRSEINFVGGRDIAAGVSTVGAYAVSANTNALNYLRQVERSELGALFCAADGSIVFRERGQVPANELLTFSDDGVNIPYQTLTNQFGDEYLYNIVSTDSPAGDEQVVSDADSITKFQVSRLSFTDLLNSSTTEVLSLAQVLLSRYKEPKVRFTGFNVQLNGLSDSQVDAVVGCELTDYAYLVKSFSVGAPSSHTQLSVLTGISHDISADSHKVTFAVENAQDNVFLVLGDSFAGRLDLALLDF
jgi:hypothetical protein